MKVNGYNIQPFEDLSGANLSGADLRNTNLRGADLSRADLRDTDLSRADLRGADLRYANLSCADLSNADLRGAYLRGANLSGADLRYANLYSVDLSRANLYSADLYSADLHSADLRGLLPVIPSKGVAFLAWKKISGNVVIQVEIPADAERTSSLIGRKCRASKVITRSAVHNVPSQYDLDTRYTENQVTFPDSYDGDIRVECTHGIHFFLTREEAERY